MPHDTKPLSNAQTRDIEALLHPYTNPAQHRRVGAHLIERGEGIYVYDEQGNRFIEGMAGLWCAGLGFGDKELIDAAKAQLDRLPYYHLFGGRTHEPAIELAEKIKDLYPVPMARVFYGSSGSEANDTQVKLIWYMMNGLGKAEEEKDHRPQERLSRHHAGRGVLDRPAAEPQLVRRALRVRQAHDDAALLARGAGRRERGAVLRAAGARSGGADPGGGAGHGRRPSSPSR